MQMVRLSICILITGPVSYTHLGAMIINHSCNDGYATVKWKVKADAGEFTVIHTLGVHPDFSGQGIAAKMLEKVFSIARKQRQKAIRLDVLRGNVPAERLYTFMGFQYIDTVSMFYEDTGWTDFELYEYRL